MIRTRDFVVFLAMAGFLVLAITVTIARGGLPSAIPAVVTFNTSTATYTAAVVAAVDTKSDRLAALRKKLAEQSSVSAVEEVIPEPEPAVEATTSEAVITAPTEATVMLCGKTYSSKTIAGLTGMQQYVERAGQRVFVNVEQPLDLGTSTAPTTPTVTDVFSLPLRSTPLAFTSCIKDDVVAISQTGGLIRNSDYVKYQGSGEATLIGYTLDGFPLYGRTNSISTDACGGAMIDGGYRYYLSAERKGVLGCFAGIPVAL